MGIGVEDIEVSVIPDINPVPDSEPVNFTATVEGTAFNNTLESMILWSVQIEEDGQWVDYGPNEDPSHQNWAEMIYSDISPVEDWIGETFTISNFHDCDLRVRGRLEICLETFDDITIVFWEAPDRSGQTTQSRCGGGNILLEIEPGKYIHPLSGNAPYEQTEAEVYWYDGPSIPIFDYQLVNNTWHTESLENVQTFEPQSGRELPIQFNLKIGEIQIRVYVPEASSYDFYDLYMLDSSSAVIWSTIQNGPWTSNCANCETKPGYIIVQPQHICPISSLSQGYYTIRVEGRFNGEPRGNFDAEAELEVYVTCVKPADLIVIVGIYEGDGYFWGGEYKPHHEEIDFGENDAPNANHNPNFNGYRIGTIDCSGLLNQLLLRLGRPLPTQFDLSCTSWGNSPYIYDISWSDLEQGDLILL